MKGGDATNYKLEGIYKDGNKISVTFETTANESDVVMTHDNESGEYVKSGEHYDENIKRYVETNPAVFKLNKGFLNSIRTSQKVIDDNAAPMSFHELLKKNQEKQENKNPSSVVPVFQMPPNESDVMVSPPSETEGSTFLSRASQLPNVTVRPPSPPSEFIEEQSIVNTPPPPPPLASANLPISPPQPPPTSKEDVKDEIEKFNESKFSISTKQKDGSIKEVEYPIKEILDKLNKKDKKQLKYKEPYDDIQNIKRDLKAKKPIDEERITKLKTRLARLVIKNDGKIMGGKTMKKRHTKKHKKRSNNKSRK
jgi:hypothetical protein